ncbi:MAG: hypothetical protein L0338_33915 [Acidobacteria bacterium]|nr:hypothetical protein [Acidobacteriota bacterium]
MSVTFSPDRLLYAVVEYLKASQHIYDPVDAKPERGGQYRLVCLVVNSDDAWRVAHVLRALSDGRYWYSVCVAEPGPLASDNMQGVGDDSQTIEIEPLNPVA